MKHLFVIIAILALCCSATYSQKPWERADQFRLDKVQPHSNVVPYSNERHLDGLNYESSFYYKGLRLAGWRMTHSDSVCDHYSRTMPYPTAWHGRRTFICFEGVSTAIQVFVNGRQVGYSEDSRTPAEFEITRYLSDSTENTMMVRLFHRSSGAIMEHDTAASFLRSVYIYSTPWRYISDYKVLALLDTVTYSQGSLEVDVELSAEVSEEMKIEVALCRNGSTITQKRKRITKGNWFLFFLPNELPVGTVETWSADSPNLYTLHIRLFNQRDSLLETIGAPVGFRHVAIRNHELWINGHPENLKGVNLEGSTSREELLIVRNLGINTLRLTDGPADEALYRTCDQIGLYVWDMANIHDTPQNPLADDRSLTDAMLYRCNNMYKRDRNHPSVVVWIPNGLATYGFNQWETSRFLSGKDNSRPVTELRWLPLNYEDLGILNFHSGL